jgi:nucleotide-binding universal stress UspA family protein
LTRTAAAVRASFVVVGAGGIAGPRRRISRGVRGLVRASPSPVLVLQGTAVIDSWLRGERPLVVAVAAAFDDKLHHLVNMARVLRGVGPCDLVVIHISFPPAEAERLHAPQPAHIVENDTPVQTLVGSDLAKIFGDLPGAGSVRVIVQPVIGRDDAYIDHVARDAKADLVVIGSHQRQGLDRLIHGATDDGVLELSAADVLVVPLRG